MINISRNIIDFKTNLPDGVTLVAVSKTKPVADIIKAYEAGHRVFGENRVHEIIEKYGELPSDIELHMIGHLQTNKVKYIVDKVDMFEGVDTIKLLRVINKESVKSNLVSNILLQFHIASEDTKYGFSNSEVEEIHNSGEIFAMKGINVCGVMGMATYTDDIEQIRGEFKFLKKSFDNLKNQFYSNNPQFKEISMGMSGDYKIAIEEGSTMIRVGSAIFGER